MAIALDGEMTKNNIEMMQILAAWARGKQPDAAAWNRLVGEELADASRARAFGVTAENVADKLAARSRLFEATVAQVQQQFPLGDRLVETLWHLWIPLAIYLAQSRDRLERPWIQGILGGQGSGKTTLTKILTLILAELGYSTIGISIDDLYKTYAERQELKVRDPRLVWRGPPGTHDVALGIELLDRLRAPNGEPVSVPRFDKSAWAGQGDRREPDIIQPADIVLFEGWFVGLRPVESAQFQRPPAPIATEGDRAFARDTNARLREYLPLWERLDSLILLYPVDYRLSLQWRMQAEREMRALGKEGMSDAQIEEFVKYFWKALHPELFIDPLVRDSPWVDLAIEINRDRSVGKIYRPQTATERSLR